MTKDEERLVTMVRSYSDMCEKQDVGYTIRHEFALKDYDFVLSYTKVKEDKVAIMLKMKDVRGFIFSENLDWNKFGSMCSRIMRVMKSNTASIARRPSLLFKEEIGKHIVDGEKGDKK